MKANYVQKGENIDYLNTGSDAIKAGDVVDLGTRIGVAGTDIAVGGLGSLHMTGVFTMTKEAGLDIAVGDLVYFNGTAITKTNTDTPAGYAVVTSMATSSVVEVKLLG